MTERLSVMSACPSAFQGDHEGTIFFFCTIFTESQEKLVQRCVQPTKYAIRFSIVLVTGRTIPIREQAEFSVRLESKGGLCPTAFSEISSRTALF